MKVSIIVPTYNEKDNMKLLMERIAKAAKNLDYEIIIVDDDSPDGTADEAIALSRNWPVKVISRKDVRGLGSAIIQGFASSRGDILGVIDADLQHPPEIIQELISAIQNGADIAIASRYIPGAGVENWTMFRKMVSKGAILLAKPLTEIKDPMSGCFFARRRVIEKVEFQAIGFKMLLEILVKGNYHRVEEVPYIFQNRLVGASKLRKTEYLEYLRLLSNLYWHKAKSRLSLKVRSRAMPKNESFARLSSMPSKKSPQNIVIVGSNKKLMVSVGICAYNEESNIGNHLRSLQGQSLNHIEVAQIVVVSSACSDKTDEIVQSFHNSDSRIELIRQPEREGKASAVNLFLQVAKGDICVLVSADTIVSIDSIECLCLPFLDPAVGMTGGHPIPVNDHSSFMGFVSHLIWDLAHELSLIEPKLGELIAFRNVVVEVPEDTAVDEAAIEVEVKKKGYVLRYVPEAIIYNRGPTTVSDFIKQRRRIYAGHLHLKKISRYEVSSMSVFRLLKLVIWSIQLNWRCIIWTPAAMILEFCARFLGGYDFHVKKKNPFVWDVASSTKKDIHL